MEKKYVQDDKHSREALMDLYGSGWLTSRWARTHGRVCPVTGRQVTLQDVEKGMYTMSRINGDSAYGYEVVPTDAWLMDILSDAVPFLMYSQFRENLIGLVNDAVEESKPHAELLESISEYESAKAGDNPLA
jgi:hypothetical protein